MFNRLAMLVLRIFLMVIATVVCFLPLELFWGLKHVLHPTGFWQNLVTYGLGLWVGGAIQFVLFIFWLMIMLTLVFFWNETIRGKSPIRFTVRRTPGK